MLSEYGRMFGKLGINDLLSFANVGAKIGDSDFMVESLEEAANLRIKQLNDTLDWEQKAGYSFYVLAKDLEKGGEQHMVASTQSLTYAVAHYNNAGIKPEIKGMSVEDIHDYMENPDSDISIQDLEFIV